MHYPGAPLSVNTAHVRGKLHERREHQSPEIAIEGYNAKTHRPVMAKTGVLELTCFESRKLSNLTRSESV